MQALDRPIVLDREQLRDVTLDDTAVMQEILEALIDDTARQLVLLEAAVRDQDPVRCGRLAHYSKGACANVGAQRAAAILQVLERRAAVGDMANCAVSVSALAREVELLRAEATTLLT